VLVAVEASGEVVEELLSVAVFVGVVEGWCGDGSWDCRCGWSWVGSLREVSGDEVREEGARDTWVFCGGAAAFGERGAVGVVEAVE
jgi:hypothetical protein